MFFEIEQKAEHFKFNERLLDGPLGNGDYPGLKREFLTPRFNTSATDRETFSDRNFKENEI
jgi:hypothetical protein